MSNEMACVDMHRAHRFIVVLSCTTGRTIGGWASDGLAVADNLNLGKFLVMGISTGGAYAFSLAAHAPDRVAGVITGCAMTDMRHPPARESMPGPGCLGIYNSISRDAALALALDIFGEDGLKASGGTAFAESLPKADLEAMMDPVAAEGSEIRQQAKFANGVQGYVDDRLADGPGWFSFDIASVKCPVTIVHGESDTIVPVVAAHHTRSLVPQAEMYLYKELGHLSISGKAFEAAAEMAAGAGHSKL